MALTEMYKYWGYDSLETGTYPDGTPIYDRAISANDAAEFEELKYSSGIAPYEDCFKIVPGGGMAITRLPGYASLGGRPAKDPNPKTVTLISGNTYYYVMEGNAEIEYRMAREGVLTAAETDIPPLRDENHYQIILALIDVPSGATEITEGMITDTRYNSDYCGIMTNKANYDWGEQLITANDIHDTDTKLIPIKTGDGGLVLRNDGYKKVNSANLDALEYIKINGVMTVLDNGGNEVVKLYNDRIKFGDYTARKNGRDIDIEYAGEETSDTGTPTEHNIKQQSNVTITDMNNTLNSSANSTFATITAAAEETMVVEVIYSYGGIDIIASATGVAITAKTKGRRNASGGFAGDKYAIALYDLDKNEIIPGTERENQKFATTAQIITTTWTFNSLADLGATNIGIRMYISTYSSTSNPIIVYWYGSDVTITQYFGGAAIGKFTPDGIITSPGGAVQTMMIQGILDNTQDILLMKEGIEI